MSTMISTARTLAGPAVRRLRREWQWRRCGEDLALRPGTAERYPHSISSHATPLFRTLSGLDDQLQRNKVVNLRLAVERLDGLVLAPGQRLSFWRQVGRPSAGRGFLDGLVLNQGRLTAGVGGGLCQLTNLLYWMTLHSPLDVVERWRHSYDVFADSGRTQPFGSGATCAYPSLDLQIANRTGCAVRLSVQVTASELRGAWTADSPATRRYEVYETQHSIVNDAPGVFTRRNILRRRVFDLDGHQLDDELVTTNHALLRYQPFLEAGS